jgi:hypothetical protein
MGYYIKGRYIEGILGETAEGMDLTGMCVWGKLCHTIDV